MPTGPSNLFAAAFVRNGDRWSGSEVDLSTVEIADDVTDVVQEALGLSGDELAILCVEVEDEWFALVRFEGDREPRAFISACTAASLASYSSWVNGNTGNAVIRYSCRWIGLRDRGSGRRPHGDPGVAHLTERGSAIAFGGQNASTRSFDRSNDSW